jgi:hypothetical protein
MPSLFINKDIKNIKPSKRGVTSALKKAYGLMGPQVVVRTKNPKNQKVYERYLIAGGDRIAIGHVVQLQRREYFESASKVCFIPQISDC